MTTQFYTQTYGLTMLNNDINNLFTSEKLNSLLPADRTDEFFDALYGDANEGAYDIKLHFSHYNIEKNILTFELRLTERPGKCLACNLTYGLPQVFSRHPLINVKGIVEKIEEMLGGQAKCLDWELGSTQVSDDKFHSIPLNIFLG